MLTGTQKRVYLNKLGVPVDYPKNYIACPLSGMLALKPIRWFYCIAFRNGWTDPRRVLYGNTLFWGFFVWLVFMANKRMISRDLVKSRRLGKLFEDYAELAEFSLNLYCLGIAHHDEKGLITADPYDWKLVIHPVAARSLKDYENALNFLEECKLFKKSPCGRVYKYYNHERIQTYRSDRDRYTQFPEIKDFK